MLSPTEIECKKICVRRCFYAVMYSCTAQYFLLTVFLLYVNYSVLHPVTWMLTTMSTIFSLYTWLYTVPLLMIVVFYGVILGRRYVAERHYAPTRFAALCSTGLDEFLFVAVHIAVAFLTTWLYSRFMHKEYSTFYEKCPTVANTGGDSPKNCINERYTLLILYGVYLGVYNFVKEPARQESRIIFPLLQQERYLKIRDNLSRILFAGIRAAFLPTIAFFIGSYALSGVLISNMAHIFGLHYSGDYMHLFDGLLFCYLAVLAAQLQINQLVMDFLFVTLLTEYRQFSVDDDPFAVKLVDALACVSVPITQELAALDLYRLSQTSAERRQQVFALSIPGGHPYVWQALSGQCLALIGSFTQELATSIDHLVVQPTASQTGNHPKFYNPAGGPATDLANKLLHRQYNESAAIRNMDSVGGGGGGGAIGSADEATGGRQRTDLLTRVTSSYYMRTERLKMGVMQLPGVRFWFSEKRCGRVSWLLANRGQTIGWTVQGLATLATSSLREDTYGVVQMNLVDIIRSLILLKQTLDRVVTVTFDDALSHTRAMAIRGIVRRSLYSITTTFDEYLPDLMASMDEYRMMRNFMSYSEV